MKKATRDTVIQAVLYFVVIVLVNVVVSGWFFRIDLTRNKINTLSPATEKLLRELKDRMLVRVYFNSGLPSPYNSNRRALTDMLQEFRSLSDGKLEYDIINPSTAAQAEKGSSEGIPQIQVQVVNNDKLEVKRAMMGLVMEYKAKRQVIPVIQSLSNFEYEMASRIERLIHPRKKIVAIAQGNGEPSFSDIQRAESSLSHRYRVISVDFSKPVPDSVSALIIIQPTRAFADSQLYNLDRYMMDKGRVAFLASGVNASMRNQYATDLNLNLSRLTSKYGFEVKKDLVRDASCASVTVMQREAGMTIQTEVPNPYIPIVSNLSRSFVVTQDLHQVVMPFPSDVDTSFAHTLHLNVVPFATSSDRSGIQTRIYDLNPTAQFTREMFQKNNLLLGVAITGKVHSAIADTSLLAKAHPNRKSEGNERIVVLGNGDFIEDAFLQNPDNLSIFLNTVDYLTDNIGLISIRSKTFLPPPLKPVSETTRAATKDFIMVFPPLLILAIGLFYWRRTVKRRKTYHESLVKKTEVPDEQND